MPEREFISFLSETFVIISWYHFFLLLLLLLFYLCFPVQDETREHPIFICVIPGIGFIEDWTGDGDRPSLESPRSVPKLIPRTHGVKD